jgi:hypothetical protein
MYVRLQLKRLLQLLLLHVLGTRAGAVVLCGMLLACTLQCQRSVAHTREQHVVMLHNTAVTAVVVVAAAAATAAAAAAAHAMP